MRGLDEIRKVNSNPGRFHGEEIHGAVHMDEINRRDDLTAIADEEEDRHRSKQRAETAGAARFFADLLIASVLADGRRIFPVTSHQDRIQPGIDQPPFLSFWQNLNDTRARAGEPEALYKEARTLFNGGETPVGAMTFIGKQWEGLRAVPSEPVTVLGGNRPIYHAEYCEVTERGTVWQKVRDYDGQPVAYKIPEAAINAAEEVRNTRRRRGFHQS
jgi:hypothetical protein